MRKLALPAVALLAALAAGVTPCMGAPPNNTAFVDPKSGVDGPNCGAPGAACASLNQALAHIAPGGTVSIQSGGVFPPIFLSAPVTIAGPADGSAVIRWFPASSPGCIGGAPGSCNGGASAGYAIEIAGGAGDVFKLSNLTIDGPALSSGALRIGNAFSVSLDDVALRATGAIAPQIMLVNPHTGTLFELFMSHCDLAADVGTGGIVVQPSGATAAAVHVSASALHGMKFGIKLDASAASVGHGVQASIDDSELFAINGSGIALIGPEAYARASLSRNNLFAIYTQALQVNGTGVLASLYENTITDSGIGINFQSNLGQVYVLGNNAMALNNINCAIGGAFHNCSSVLLSQPQN